MSFDRIDVGGEQLEKIFERVNRWSEDCRYLISIDENGTENIEHVKSQLRRNGIVDKIDRFFTLTGIILCREQYHPIMKQVMDIKKKYWDGGFWEDKSGQSRRVVFHSHDIRKHNGPYSLLKNSAYSSFINDVSSLIISLRGKSCIISITIDKQASLELYGNDMYNSYNQAVSLLLERFCFFLNKRSQAHKREYKGTVIFESRGRDADERVRNAIRAMIIRGNNFNNNKLFFDRINSVGFLRKYTNDYQKSHFTLELADLVSYPIYQYVRDGIKRRPFEELEPLLDRFPNYTNYGLKIFP
jgi:hypothetical protein